MVRKVSTPRVAALWFLSSVSIAVAGPFGTYRSIGLAGRLLYWAAIMALAFAAGAAASTLVERCCRQRGFWSRQVIGAIFFALIVLPVLSGVSMALAGAHRAPTLAPGQMAVVILIAPLCVGLMKALWLPPATGTPAQQDPAGQAAPEAQVPAPGPRLLERLAPERRGAILHLSVRDHYVVVLTDRGEDTILMRFSDAMAELEGLDGLRVHRSHWVAAAAVAGAAREGGRVVLHLSGGRRVPVSRSYLDAVAARGWI